MDQVLEQRQDGGARLLTHVARAVEERQQQVGQLLRARSVGGETANLAQQRELAVLELGGTELALELQSATLGGTHERGTGLGLGLGGELACQAPVGEHELLHVLEEQIDVRRQQRRRCLERLRHVREAVSRLVEQLLATRVLVVVVELGLFGRLDGVGVQVAASNVGLQLGRLLILDEVLDELERHRQYRERCVWRREARHDARQDVAVERQHRCELRV